VLEKLAEIEAHYRELLVQMANPEIISNHKKYQELAQEHRGLEPLMHTYEELVKTTDQLAENLMFINDEDPDIREMAQEEIATLNSLKESLLERVKVLMLPTDPLDEKNVILEVRAGTGGDEAALFAGDIFRMYTRFAEGQGWKVELLSGSETALGGFKEVVCSIEGQKVYSRLKYESGVHRVQRVPTTETQGRIHTSACTVAILPEADEVDVDLPAQDLRIDVYRSSGPGGQSVNTTDSAIRATHLPTGLVVTCQDEKSQHKNKAKALKILRARLLEKAQAEAHAERAANRKSQVGSGDRSERIRTYNFPQNRLTDHRIGLTLYRLEQIMMGELAECLDAVIAHFQAEALKASDGTH
jgi:peptide chain release factor 1